MVAQLPPMIQALTGMNLEDLLKNIPNMGSIHKARPMAPAKNVEKVVADSKPSTDKPETKEGPSKPQA